jgi:hypothetical protein
VPARPLGLADTAAYAWRKRGGQASFRIARKAEERGDWPAVATACQRALAADPLHLEASWLLAVAYAKTGNTQQIVAPLQVAEAGDFGKWGAPSVELPALHGFVATPAGQAWRRRVDADRAAYTAALAHAVIAISAGDVFAYEAENKRWLRLTRTSGGVLATMPSADGHQLAYVARTHPRTKLGVGTIDLATGLTTRPVDVGANAFVVASGPKGFWVGGPTWRQLDGDTLHPVAGSARPPGPWLEVAGKTVRLHRLPVSDVSADWDDHSLASAIRIGRSNRVVSVPSPGLIDGNTIVWSPDRSRLAFVAQLDEHCTPGKSGVTAAGFVVETATGRTTELERAQGGLAIDWLGAHRLAVAGDRGVALVDLDTNARTQLDGATALGTPRRKPRCTPDTPDDTATPDEPEPAD